MPQRIEVPGQGIIEFPDGMDDAAIVKAIQGLRQPKAAPLQMQGVGPGQAALISAGRRTDQILDGLTQMYLKARGEDSALAALAQKDATKREEYAPLREAFPKSTGVGEALPSMAVPIGAAAGVGRIALAGALPGALSYGTAEEKAKEAATGAIGNVAGSYIGKGVAKLLQPVGSAISKTAQDAAQRLGLKLTAGELTQNPALLNVENYFARSPGSSGAMQATQAAKQEALQRAAAGAMRQTGGDLSEGGFAAAKQSIGDEFTRLQGITAPKLGQDFFQTLADLEASNAAKGSFRSAKIDNVINKGLDLAAQGNLTGKAYKEIRTELSNAATKAFKNGDATAGQAFKTLRTALDDAAEQSLSGADREAWKLAREQWSAYKLLSKSNVAEGGTLSAPRLAAAMRQQGDSLRTGTARGPLADIARIGEAVKSSQNPNSGQLMQQMMYGNPITGIPLVLGNKAAQSAYMSAPVQRYLSRGLLNVSPEAQLLLTKGGGLLGTPAIEDYFGVQ